VGRIEDCKKFIECLSAHFDGELDGDLLIEFEEHLERCERAQALIHTFERTIVLHRKTRGLVVPEDVHARLMAALRACSEEQD
jgi:anti-sigma factor RsiW